MKTDNRTKLIRRLRRRVKVHRRFKVEWVPPDSERLTCTECGWTVVQPVGGGGVARKLAERLAKYRAQGSGVTGHCPQCSKRRAEERYPL